MSLWLFRAGSRGQHEKRFLDEGRVYLTWDKLKRDLSKVATKRDLYDLLVKLYPEVKMPAIRNWTGQVWPIAHEMKEGDWIVLPSKLKKAAIHFGEICGPYVFVKTAEDPFFHYRAVKWFATDIPRSNFDQDILYSFGSAMTVCRIARNEAEKRVRAMASHGWKSATVPPVSGGEEAVGVETVDLELLARDQIAKLIIQKFKGHGLARLVETILMAQGYTTYLSPEGPDKGVDILAAPGPLGFGRPRLCIQVKSGDTPVDAPTLNNLIGAMQNVQADQGLLVSWAGFKTSIDKEIPAQFFRVRLWDQDTLIDELLSNYEKLDEDLRAEIPLKRIWSITTTDDEE